MSERAPAVGDDPGAAPGAELRTAPVRVTWLTWVVRAVCVLALLVVAWVLVQAWPVVVHGHPAYAIALGTAVTLALLVGVRAWRDPKQPTGWRAWWRGALVVLSLVGVGALWWLTPFVAVEPALAAMESDDVVIVDEYPTQIVMTPRGSVSATSVFFQPGARVDARAYAAVLRPLAVAGQRVVISKQPFGIAFFNTMAFSSVQAAYPDVADWTVGGHSLGGTVACIDADAHDSDAAHPVRGLLLYASYPATDMSTSLTASVLSISGSEDGLATPAKVDAATPLLPRDTEYRVIEGAVHSYFGDYGPQPGDGTPTISHDDARDQISSLSVQFVNGRPA